MCNRPPADRRSVRYQTHTHLIPTGGDDRVELCRGLCERGIAVTIARVCDKIIGCIVDINGFGWSATRGIAVQEVQSLPPPVYKYSSQMLRDLEELHKRIADGDEDVPAVIRMHSNESPLPPPAHVVASITEYAQRYASGSSLEHDALFVFFFFFDFDRRVNILI